MKNDGQITVFDTILGPRTEETVFLASKAGEGAIPRVFNGIYHSYYLPKAAIAGQECSMSFGFVSGVLRTISITLHSAVGPEWLGKEREPGYLVEQRTCHKLWLGKVLESTPTDKMEFDWGTVETTLDMKGWGAGILIRYRDEPGRK